MIVSPIFYWVHISCWNSIHLLFFQNCSGTTKEELTFSFWLFHRVLLCVLSTRRVTRTITSAHPMTVCYFIIYFFLSESPLRHTRANESCVSFLSASDRFFFFLFLLLLSSLCSLPSPDTVQLTRLSHTSTFIERQQGIQNKTTTKWEFFLSFILFTFSTSFATI